jgi:hypothetical protein
MHPIIWGAILLFAFMAATYGVKFVCRYLLKSLWNVYQILIANVVAWIVLSLIPFSFHGTATVFMFCSFVQLCWMLFDLIMRPKSREETANTSWYVYHLGVFAGQDAE